MLGLIKGRALSHSVECSFKCASFSYLRLSELERMSFELDLSLKVYFCRVFVLAPESY